MSERHDAKDRSTPTDVRDQLKRVIERSSLDVAFQPIVDLRTAEIIGYEALSRPKEGCGFDGPAELFIAADEFGVINEMEQLARRTIFNAVKDLGHDQLLFFNNSPPVFTSDSFVEMISEEIEFFDHLELNRIVLEVTERTSPNLIADMNVRALLLREMGFQVAIDDVGAGVNGLNQIMSLRPNWIKLDRELINHIDYDPLKQNLIRTFVRFTKFSNIELIAEGVERSEELCTLIELGVTHAQGFYLARPGTFDQRIEAETRELILERQEQTAVRRREDVHAVRLGSLCVPAQVFDRKTPVEDVQRASEQSVLHNGVVVQDGRRYIGWISAAMLDRYLKDAGPGAVIGGCPRHDCAVTAEDESLAEALEMVSSRPEEQLSLPIVVQQAGSIVGLVPLRNLLRAAARTQRQNLTHFEPLTGLPSRVNADQWLADRIRCNDPVDLAFIDLRDFDSYNLTYGAEMGDGMLLRVAGLIRRVSTAEPERIKFTAHLGGDRFLVGCTSDCRDLLRTIASEFESQRKEFFTAMDVAAEAYNSQSPTGERESQPLTEMRVIYLQQPLLNCSHPRELHELAAQLRIRTREASMDNDSIVMDRRSKSQVSSASA